MPSSREYPDRPIVGIGGVVIDGGRALLIRRASEPLRGEWSIPGGMLELGETLEEGVARELLEETGLHVRVLDLIEVFERIIPGPDAAGGVPGKIPKPRYHFVIADYLCERISGDHAAASDVTALDLPPKTTWTASISPKPPCAFCTKPSPCTAPAAPLRRSRLFFILETCSEKPPRRVIPKPRFFRW